jgi:hypothetical protein
MKLNELTEILKTIWAWIIQNTSLAFIMALGAVFLFYYQLVHYESTTRHEALTKQTESSIIDTLASRKAMLEQTLSKTDTTAKSINDSLQKEIDKVKILLTKRDSTLQEQERQKLLVEYKEESDYSVAGLFLLCVFFVAIGSWEFVKYKLSDEESEKDRDPEELEMVFDKYSDLIVALATPRKLKRFSNKVRFQYNLFKKSGSIVTYPQLELFFLILLSMDSDRRILKLEFDKFAEALAVKMYETYHQKGIPVPLHENIGSVAELLTKLKNEDAVVRLYKYNRNSLI